MESQDLRLGYGVNSLWLLWPRSTDWVAYTMELCCLPVWRPEAEVMASAGLCSLWSSPAFWWFIDNHGSWFMNSPMFTGHSLACVSMFTMSPFPQAPTLMTSSLLIASARNLYLNKVTCMGTVLSSQNKRRWHCVPRAEHRRLTVSVFIGVSTMPNNWHCTGSGDKTLAVHGLIHSWVK